MQAGTLFWRPLQGEGCTHPDTGPSEKGSCGGVRPLPLRGLCSGGGMKERATCAERISEPFYFILNFISLLLQGCDYILLRGSLQKERGV